MVHPFCDDLSVTCCSRYQGHVSAALVLGGVDVRGPHLFTVYPHGSTDALPYATMGSGSLNAMAVFENGFRCTSSSVTHVLGEQYVLVQFSPVGNALVVRYQHCSPSFGLPSPVP